MTYVLTENEFMFYDLRNKPGFMVDNQIINKKIIAKKNKYFIFTCC